MLILRHLCIFLLIGIGLHFIQLGLSGSPAFDQLSAKGYNLDRIAAEFRASHKRLPSDRELTQLLDKKIQDDLLHKEALRLGLHKNDTVVKARLAQNFSFTDVDKARMKPPLISEFTENDVVIYRRLIERMKALIVSQAPQPQTAELKSYYLANITRYRYPTRYRVFHQFVPAASYSLNLKSSVSAVSSRENKHSLSFIDANKFYSLKNLAKILPGPAITAIESGKEINRPDGWQIHSQEGLHQLRVLATMQPQPIPFEYVKNAVQLDLMEELKQKAVTAYLNKIKAHYQIETSKWIANGKV